MIEQLLGNQVTGTSRSVIRAAGLLFRNPEGSSSSPMKPGANPNNARNPGLRSFVRRLQQYACTHDLRSMSDNETIALFPDLVEEFGVST
jgi:hypothetical protein